MGTIADMRGIRVAQGVLVGAGIIVGVLIGIATNAASTQTQPWPGPLRWAQAEPWWAALTLAGAAVVIALVLEVLNWRAARQDAVAGPPAGGSGSGSTTALGDLHQQQHGGYTVG